MTYQQAKAILADHKAQLERKLETVQEQLSVIDSIIAKGMLAADLDELRQAIVALASMHKSALDAAAKECRDAMQALLNEETALDRAAASAIIIPDLRVRQ